MFRVKVKKKMLMLSKKKIKDFLESDFESTKFNV